MSLLPLAPSWVGERTGVTLALDRPGVTLALRRNPRRAHLLVSALLGKHQPVPAAAVLDAATELGALVRAAVGGAPSYVVGFAETATALGHAVARVSGPGGGPAPYAHTTRRPLPDGLTGLSFQEEHSHAVEQLLAVADEDPLTDPGRILVLVDDELSTGRTAVNAIAVLQQRWPRTTYVLACLLDVRSPAQQALNVAEVAALGARLVSVSLATGQVTLPADLGSTAAALLADLDQPAHDQPAHDQPAHDRPADGPATVSLRPAAPVSEWALGLTAPLTGAHGWTPADEDALTVATRALAAQLVLAGTGLAGTGLAGTALAGTALAGSVLVLGDEEFLYAGQRLALALGPQACTSSTTRSPALVLDVPGYPLRTALTFGATDDPERAAYAYNVRPSSAPDRGPAPGFEHIVLLLDRPVPAHTRDRLLPQLAAAATTGVVVVVVSAADALTVRRTA